MKFDTPPFTVALTGGIASGKTTVANHFAKRGATIIDADFVARELVARGQPALVEITTAFGREMLTRGRIEASAQVERSVEISRGDGFSS